MKKSNKIIFAAIAAIFIFSIAFQLSVNRYLRNSETKIETDVDISEQRNVANFDKINVSQGIEVYFTQDSLTKVEVEASKNDITHIKTSVKNQELFIERDDKSKITNTVKVHISNKQLSSVKASSKAYFETIGTVMGNELRLDFSSDTKANLNLSYTSVKCKAASGSQIKFKGNTSNIEFAN